MSLLFGDESIFFIFTASFIYKLRRREGSDERKNLHKHSSFSRHHSRGDWKGVSGAKNFTNILPFLVIDAKARVYWSTPHFIVPTSCLLLYMCRAYTWFLFC
ncbi:uncharacterized protein LOC114725903 isoform X2 [Neltuma alba]|uniref:uncharacterized protein LOC114725903 isoform X2 n=1 Tax=Neltuma alba TaxID=207710 RepID=UPI0010A3B9D4|nr:uncharacterized protein LOC114725903 isoform X2 [Prosopis alba]